MRRPLLIVLLGALALVAVLATAGFAWQRSRPLAYAPRGPGDVYLALGDSLAFGFRLDRPEAESYPALLHAALAGRAPLELASLAAPGETSASFIGRQLPQARELIAAARAAGRRVSPITLDIGGNDLRAVERAAPAERAAAVEAVRRNVGRILDELRAAAPDADIAVMTYYNPYGGDPAIEDGDAYWVAQMNTAIAEEAARRGAAVADGYGALGGGRAYTHTFILLGDVHATAFLDALAYP
jgi:lysophospholipase L1-like esterase